MNPLNRYSLLIGGGLIALIGAAIGVVWKPVAGASVALASILGFTAMWRALRTGPSTLGSITQLRDLLGSGTPVLVEVYSDT